MILNLQVSLPESSNLLSCAVLLRISKSSLSSCRIAESIGFAREAHVVLEISGSFAPLLATCPDVRSRCCSWLASSALHSPGCCALARICATYQWLEGPDSWHLTSLDTLRAEEGLISLYITRVGRKKVGSYGWHMELLANKIRRFRVQVFVLFENWDFYFSF